MYAQRQLAYAPTPYSYTPSTLSATINLDEVFQPKPNIARELLNNDCNRKSSYLRIMRNANFTILLPRCIVL